MLHLVCAGKLYRNGRMEEGVRESVYNCDCFFNVYYLIVYILKKIQARCIYTDEVSDL